MELAQKDEEMLHDWRQKIKDVQMTRSEMNMLVMNYLEKEGFKEAAEKFQAESGVSPSIDLNTLDQRILIRTHIQNGEIAAAIRLINELHPELLDSDNKLYFLLQQQHLIELIRRQEIVNALDYAQNHVSERAEDGDEDILSELEKTLALLAFDDALASPFGELLALSHRQKVAGEVNAKILEQENQESTPQITKVLKLLVWSQQQLDAKKVKYVKMTDLANGELQLS